LLCSDAEVLSMFAMIINRLRGKMEAEVPRIFGAVFECTLQMITRNFEDYPEHRLQFFSLLRAITNHCSATLFAMSQVGQPLSLRRPLPCSPPRMSPQLLPCCNCSLQAGCPLHPPSSLVPSCAFSSLTLSDTSLDSPLPWRRRPS
jgi:hypothetical protein